MGLIKIRFQLKVKRAGLWPQVFSGIPDPQQHPGSMTLLSASPAYIVTPGAARSARAPLSTGALPKDVLR